MRTIARMRHLQETTLLKRASWTSGLALAAGAAVAAYRAGTLTAGGAACATLVGAMVYTGTGWRGSSALATYFLTSSALGRLPSRPTRSQRRGNRRDAIQVLSNGSVPALMAACAIATSPAVTRTALIGYAGAVATATADTWSTEIGIRYGGVPRSIVSLRPLPAGTSGGASVTGLLASAAGSALVATILSSGDEERTPIYVSGSFMAFWLAGMAGSLSDSLLGATVQEVRYCPACEERTEVLVHACGAPTDAFRGLSWCNNDAVNLISIAIGAVASLAIHRRLTGSGSHVTFETSGAHDDVCLALPISRSSRSWQHEPGRE